MAIRYGSDSFAGVGKETTWGTPVARTTFQRFIGRSGGFTADRRDIPTWQGRSPEGHVDFGKKGLPTITHPLAYEKLLLQLRNLLGGYAFAVIEAGRNSHTFTISATKPSPLTFEHANTEANADIYSGAYIRRGAFTMKADDFSSIALDYVSKAPTSAVKSAAPTYADLNTLVVKPSQIVVNDGVGSVNAFDLNFTAETGMNEGLSVLGSSDIIEPEWEGKHAVTGSFSRYYSDATMQARFVDGATFVVTGTATGPTLLAGTYSMVWLISKAVVIGDPVVEADAGRVRETVNFRAEHDATNTALKITVINTEATL